MAATAAAHQAPQSTLEASVHAGVEHKIAALTRRLECLEKPSVLRFYVF